MDLFTWTPIVPEIWQGLMACLVLMIDLWTAKFNRHITYYLAMMTLFGTMLLILPQIGSGTHEFFNHAFIQDELAHLLKIITAFVGLFVFMYSRKYVFEHKLNQGEYYGLCLFSILGMMVLISAHSLLTVYLGIELLALPLYALIAMSKDKRAPEAAMKYFVMGALASGLLLYGISLIYGATGSYEITTVSSVLLQHQSSQEITVIMGMVLMLVGLSFKLGVVPFHMWVPDIYEGSANSVTLFIATLPEIAGFGMAIRLLTDSFSALNTDWQELWMLMSVLSLVVGNVAAIAQTNIKRMLAYSSIGHMGFVFLGLLDGPDVGFYPALLYMVIYVLMALGAFGLLTALSYQGFEAENLNDLRGLGKTEPWIAFLMMIILFSLAGIPPTIGFYAKFIILQGLVDAGHLWLAGVAVLFTVIGAFYYLRVIRLMFFDSLKSDIKLPPCQRIPLFEKTILSLNGLSILLLGIYPAPLITLSLSVF